MSDDSNPGPIKINTNSAAVIEGRREKKSSYWWGVVAMVLIFVVRPATKMLLRSQEEPRGARAVPQAPVNPLHRQEALEMIQRAGSAKPAAETAENEDSPPQEAP